MSKRTVPSSPRKLALERLEGRRLLTVLFSEQFPSPAFDPARWDDVAQAAIQGGFDNLPSGPLAAVLRGGTTEGDRLSSVWLELSGESFATISYFFRRGAGADAPAAGEDLVLEARTEGGDWIEVDRQRGDLPAGENFTRRDIVVDFSSDGGSGDGGRIQFRLRNLATRGGAAQWLLDDIQVRTGSSQISGRVVHDTSGNGLAEAGELPLAGWRVYVDSNNNRVYDSGEPSALTGADGSYTIAGLGPGEVTVRQTPPSGWQQSSTSGGVLGFDEAGSLIDSPTDLRGVRSIVLTRPELATDDLFLYVAASGNGTISVLRRDQASGTLSVVQTLQDDPESLATVSDTSALVLSTDQRHLYTVSGTDNRLILFERDLQTGALQLTASYRSDSGGVAVLDFPTALTVSPDDRQLYVASANPGGVTLFDRDPASGQLSIVEFYSNTPGLIDGLGGAEALTLSPDGGYLYVAGTAESAIAVFSRDAATGRLTFVESIRNNSIGLDSRPIDGLGGVRSLSISGDGRHLYAASSFDDAIAVFARDEPTGRLRFVYSLQDGTDGAENLDGPIAVEVDQATGLYVYVATLNDDAITVFKRDPVQGVLTLLETRQNGFDSVQGLDSPRSLAIDTTGKLLFSAGFGDNGVTAFDTQTTAQTVSITNDWPMSGIDFAIARSSTLWQPTGDQPLWSAAENWTAAVGPLAGDLLRFEPGESQDDESQDNETLLSQNDLADGFSIEGLQLIGDGIDLSGNRIQINAPLVPAIASDGGENLISLPIEFVSPAEIRVLDGTLKMTGDLDFQDQPITVNVEQDAELLLTSLLTGSGDLVKQGEGKLTIDIGGDFRGASRVEAGELSFGGLTTDDLGVIVGPGAVLTGSGSFAGPLSVKAAGRVAPGKESTALLSAGPLTMDALSQLDLQFNGNGLGQSDSLQVSGTVQLDGATLLTSLGYQPAAGDLLTIIANDGIDPVQGTFAGLPEGAALQMGDYQFHISYRGGDGNDVVLRLPWTGSVEGIAWNDLNGDRVKDEQEPVLTGQTVYVDLNGSGNLDAGDPLGLTDAAGRFVITSVPEGTFRIAQVLPGGWQQTSPRSGTQSLTLIESLQDELLGVSGLDAVRALAVSPDGRFLYTAANNDDSVAVFQTVGDGTLAFVESLADGSGSIDGLNGARSVAVSPDGRHVYVGGYFDDAVAVFGRDAETGRLNWLSKIKNGEFVDDGSGGETNGDRITGLNGTSSVVVAPDIEGRSYVYVAGYLDDSIATFSRDADSGALSFVESIRDGSDLLDGLDGVSQLIVSPDTRYLYAAGTNDDSLAVFSIDSATGKLTFVQKLDSSSGAAGLQLVRALAISPDGQSVYAVSDFENSIAQFGRDSQTGRLSFVDVYRNGQLGISGLLGAASVAVSADGTRVFVTAATSEALVMFDRDPASGLLSMADFVDDEGTLAGAWAVVTAADADVVYVAGLEADAVSVFGLAQPEDLVTVVAGRSTGAAPFGSYQLVSEVAVRGSNWGPDFLLRIKDAGLGPSGFSVWNDRFATSPVVPIAGVDVVEVFFSGEITPRRSDLSVRGATSGTLPIIAFGINQAAQSASWQFQQPAAEDRLQFSLFGGSFQTVVPLLPGDVNQDSLVDEADLAIVLGAQFATPTDAAYDPRADADTDSVITLIDVIRIRRRIGTLLPEAGDDPTGDDPLPSLEDSLAAPQVSAALVRGTNWSAEFLGQLSQQSLGDGGLQVGRNAIDHLAPLPWNNIDQVSLRFSESIALVPGDLTLQNSENQAQSLIGYRYDLATNTATWTFAQPLAQGEYTIRLRGGATDAQGNPLGTAIGPGLPPATPTSTTPMPEIGDLAFRLSVLPGDVNRDRTVDAPDLTAVYETMFSQIGGARYSVFADMDADGQINVIDLLQSRRRQRTQLSVAAASVTSLAASAIVTEVPAMPEVARLWPAKPISPEIGFVRFSTAARLKDGPTAIVNRNGDRQLSEGSILRSSRSMRRDTTRCTERQRATDLLFRRVSQQEMPPHGASK